MAASASPRPTQGLAQRLRERRGEIEGAVLARVYAVEDPATVLDPEYAMGLRTAVDAGLGCAFSAIAGGVNRVSPAPPALLSQARQAARSGVSLDTVLRRYCAGHTLICEYLIQGALEEGNGEGSGLRRALRSQGELLDRLVAAVTRAYADESDTRLRGSQQRHAERVKALIRGDLVELGELGYDLQGWHLGVVAVDLVDPQTLRDLAQALDRRLLVVTPAPRKTWAWFGGGRKLETERLVKEIHRLLPADGVVAIGEPARGVAGWRLTHQQAAAALPVAIRTEGEVVRYADVALLAASLRDEILAGSLDDLYLAPLLEERDGGEALRQTARAYFAASRNVSAAAAALRVSRQTVAARLRTIEERIGRPPDECAAEIETALRLQELGLT